MALLFQLTQKLSQGFSAFWARYPVRKAKQDAEKAWNQKVTPEIEEQIHAALDWQIQEWEALDWYTPPLPATYIRQARYTDQPTTKKVTLNPAIGRRSEDQVKQQDAMNQIQFLIRRGLTPEAAKAQVYRELGWIKGDQS